MRENKRWIARRTLPLLVILTSWFFFDTFLIFLWIVVAVHTFYAGTELVHFLTKLIFWHTSTIWLEDIVRITFKTFSIAWYETVGQLTSIIKQRISFITHLASTNKVRNTSINLTWLSLSYINKRRSTRGTSSINIVTSPFLSWAYSITIQSKAIFTFQTSIPLISLETIRVNSGTLSILIQIISRDTWFTLIVDNLLTMWKTTNISK